MEGINDKISFLDEPKQPHLPLLRLVFQIHNDKQQFNAIRFGQQYAGKVANPEDMLLLKKVFRKRQGKSVYADEYDESDNVVSEGTFSEQVERLLQVYMDDKNTPLQIMTTKGLCEATSRFMDNNDENAFEDVVRYYMEKTRKKLGEMEFEDEDIEYQIQQLHENTTEDADQSAVSYFRAV